MISQQVNRQTNNSWTGQAVIMTPPPYGCMTMTLTGSGFIWLSLPRPSISSPSSSSSPFLLSVPPPTPSSPYHLPHNTIPITLQSCFPFPRRSTRLIYPLKVLVVSLAFWSSGLPLAYVLRGHKYEKCLEYSKRQNKELKKYESNQKKINPIMGGCV